MAHSYPPGEQARWNELERRILQTDVDIKRLWKAMPQEGITSPAFDGPVADEVPIGDILIFDTNLTTSGVNSSYTTFISSQGGAVASLGKTAIPNGQLSLTPLDVSDFSLIYIFHTNGSGVFPSWLSAATVASWLAGSKQRRLVISGEHASFAASNAQINTYLSGIGAALRLVDDSIGNLVPGAVASPLSHYLTTGITGLTFGLSSKPINGTDLFDWTGSFPGVVSGIESTSIGSEIILMGDINWALTHPFVNRFFIWKLYPHVTSFGGTPVP